MRRICIIQSIVGAIPFCKLEVKITGKKFFNLKEFYLKWT